MGAVAAGLIGVLLGVCALITGRGLAQRRARKIQDSATTSAPVPPNGGAPVVTATFRSDVSEADALELQVALNARLGGEGFGTDLDWTRRSLVLRRLAPPEARQRRMAVRYLQATDLFASVTPN
jgi:hypothetical protein